LSILPLAFIVLSPMKRSDDMFGSESHEPVEIALREITATKHLLQALITASESFDYHRAKATLQELELKVKVLGRVQAELMTQRPPLPEHIIPFPSLSRAGA
jgi:hypothetical protein